MPTRRPSIGSGQNRNMTGRHDERWSAPGSLLIAGEYLVTEEGGSGLALAAGGRARLRIKSAPFKMEGRIAGRTEHWTLNDRGDESLASAVWCECSETGSSTVEDSRYKLTVDTGDFYDNHGRKLGYGSSAAAALLYTCGLCTSPDINEVTRSALRAHRSWQGGRGSGYDILSSAQGGAGHFTGGHIPTWSPLRWPERLNGWIIKGPGSVNSPQAIDRYRAWKQKIRIQWDRIPVIADLINCFQEVYQILSGCSEPDPGDFLEILHQMAVGGSRLGREIGVPAMPIIPGGFSVNTQAWYRPGAGASKCLGAGDEIILLMTLPDGLSRKEEAVLRKLKLAGIAVPLRAEKAGLMREGPS